MSQCPVLQELAAVEDYDPEHEQVPHLSGGDYDIAAIRACCEECRIGEVNRRLAAENMRLRTAIVETIRVLDMVHMPATAADLRAVLEKR